MRTIFLTLMFFTVSLFGIALVFIGVSVMCYLDRAIMDMERTVQINKTEAPSYQVVTDARSHLRQK